MEVIKKEVIHTFDMYRAYDGQEFTDKAECEKYEKSAECLLLSKYNKLVVKKDFEYKIFGCGSDDSYVDIVKVSCKEDVDIIMHTFGIFNSNMLLAENKDKYEKLQDTIVKAWSKKDSVFIFRGYDNSSFWIEDTLSDRISNIIKACKHDFSGKIELSNE